jgi:uncharacterized phiE125 gp8 family phage protein
MTVTPAANTGNAFLARPAADRQPAGLIAAPPMHVAVVTPPAAVVSLDDAKAHLRVDHAEDDTLILALVAAATARLDGPAGILNRALGDQALQASLDGFPREPTWRGWRPVDLRLPCAPVTAVESITYVAADGTSATVAPEVYELTADGRLRLAHGQSWPQPRSDRDPVTITFQAGYEALPPPLRAAILLMVADLYANRESGGIGERAFEAPMTTTVDRLISPFRNLSA